MIFQNVTKDAVSGLTAEYLVGAETRLYPQWGAEITPAYDRFYLLLEGDFCIEIDGRHYDGKPGQLFFLPRHTHQFYHAYGNPNARKIWFHALYGCRNGALSQQVDMPAFIQVDDMAYMTETFRRLLILADCHDLSASVAQQSIMLEIMAYYLGHFDGPPVMMARSQQYADILDYIDAHLREPLSTAGIAQAFGYSESYFIRFFKRGMDVTPITYIMNRRLEYAKTLLQTTDLTIEAIAFETGFDDPNYFARVFRKQTGYTPSCYRNNSKTHSEDFVKRAREMAGLRD